MNGKVSNHKAQMQSTLPNNTKLGCANIYLYNSRRMERHRLVSPVVPSQSTRTRYESSEKKVLKCVTKVDILHTKVQKQGDYCIWEVTNTSSRGRMLPQGDMII